MQKVKSVQKSGDIDCQLHSLVNAGVCSYETALKLNKEFKKKYVEFIGKDVNFTGNIYPDHPDIFPNQSFTQYALNKLKIKSLRIFTKEKICSLPKNFIGLVGIYNEGGNNAHQVFIKNEYVYDSLIIDKIHIEKYTTYKNMLYIIFIYE